MRSPTRLALSIEKMTVAGVISLWRERSSARNTLFEHRRMDSGSSMTTMPSAAGAACESEGVVIDTRGFSDEERIELGEGAVVLACDEPRAHADRLGGGDESLERLGVRGWHLVIRVVEDRQVVFGARLVLARAVAALDVLLGLAHGEGVVLWRDLVGADDSHRLDGPLGSVVGGAVALELNPKERRGELIEDRQAEAVVAGRDVAPEIDAQLELVGFQRLECVLDQVVHLLRRDAHDGREPEVLECAHGRERSMPAGLGEEGDVVPGGLIAVGAAEVEDLGARHGGVFWERQVVAR